MQYMQYIVTVLANACDVPTKVQTKQKVSELKIEAK